MDRSVSIAFVSNRLHGRMSRLDSTTHYCLQRLFPPNLARTMFIEYFTAIHGRQPIDIFEGCANIMGNSLKNWHHYNPGGRSRHASLALSAHTQFMQQRQHAQSDTRFARMHEDEPTAKRQRRRIGGQKVLVDDAGVSTGTDWIHRLCRLVRSYSPRGVWCHRDRHALSDRVAQIV